MGGSLIGKQSSVLMLVNSQSFGKVVSDGKFAEGYTALKNYAAHFAATILVDDIPQSDLGSDLASPLYECTRECFPVACAPFDRHRTDTPDEMGRRPSSNPFRRLMRSYSDISKLDIDSPVSKTQTI